MSETKPRLAACPTCKKLIEYSVNNKFRPFCSERCRNVDLFRWSEGKYAIVEPLTELPDTLDPVVDDEIE